MFIPKNYPQKIIIEGNASIFIGKDTEEDEVESSVVNEEGKEEIRRLTIYMPRKMHTALKMVARAENTSMNQITIDALGAVLTKERIENSTKHFLDEIF